MTTLLARHDTGVVQSEFSGDPDYVELLELFAQALPERRGRLKSTFKAGQIVELRLLAHQLKGAGGGYGFPELTERAAELEATCKAREASAIASALERLLEYIDRIAI
jgi:histidine phosphotransfer protein HptB